MKNISKLTKEEQDIILDSIIEYINISFKSIKEANDAIDNCQLLNKFLHDLEIKISSKSTVKKLINKNQILEENIKYIMNSQIDTSKYELLQLLIYTYKSMQDEIYSDKDTLAWHLQDIRNNTERRILTLEEEREYANEIKKGNLEKRDELIYHNFGLVLSIAKKHVWSTKQLSYMDIVQEGYIGLIKAANNFDPDKGTFATYARIKITQAIRRAIVNTDKSIRIPNQKYQDTIKIIQAQNKYYQEHQKEPSNEELERLTGMSQKLIKILKKCIEKIKNDPVSIDDETTLVGKKISDNSYVSDEAMKELMTEEFLTYIEQEIEKNKLNRRDVEIFFKYRGIFGYNIKKVPELMDEYNLSRQGIYRVINNTSKKLRKAPTFNN